MNVDATIRTGQLPGWEPLRRLCVSACAILLVTGPVAVAAADTAQPKSAEQLVDEALEAEATGDVNRRETLLNEAVETNPDFALARWERGEIAVDDGWLSVEDAQRAAANDPQRVEYLILRKQYGDSAEGQLALARWCRQHGLEDEARVHWTNVLTRNPNNEEALNAIGVRWYNNQLLSYEEIRATKERARQAHRAAKRWEPQVARWERQLGAGDIISRDQALGEIKSLTDVDAIPALEEITLRQNLPTNTDFERSMQMGLALVEALDALSAQPATESLLRHAIAAPIESVREAAMSALKRRPMHNYVPLLLGNLTMPIESSFRVATDSDGSVHYWHSLYREGRNADWSVESRNSVFQFDFDGSILLVDRNNKVTGERREPDYEVALRKGKVAQRSRKRFGSAAVSAQQEVAQINRTTLAVNQRIYPILRQVTDQQIADDPRAWWNWWDERNDYYSGDHTRVYEQRYVDTELEYYRAPMVGPAPHSCFAAGTLVWTKTGLREIETIEIGDLVLAQDTQTGELDYKAVMGRTLRPKRQTVRLQLGDETLQATLGHPMWVAGEGWKMAKELEPGTLLHGVRGPVLVDGNQSATTIDVYNLIVDELHDYFVGQAGILVHDNSPRRPTVATVPGLVAN
jgi:Pretoxin HINT domain